jgi:hypothetical protein
MAETNAAAPAAKPVPTNVKDLYAELEKAAMAGDSRGQKAETIRKAVEDIAKQIGKTKVAASAVYKIVKAQFGDNPKVERSYFNNVIQKAWQTTKDENNVVWILLDKPVTK